MRKPLSSIIYIMVIKKKNWPFASCPRDYLQQHGFHDFVLQKVLVPRYIYTCTHICKNPQQPLAQQSYFFLFFPLNRSFFFLPSFFHGLSIEIAVKCQAAFQVHTPNLFKKSLSQPPNVCLQGAVSPEVYVRFKLLFNKVNI